MAQRKKYGGNLMRNSAPGVKNEYQESAKPEKTKESSLSPMNRGNFRRKYGCTNRRAMDIKEFSKPLEPLDFLGSLEISENVGFVHFPAGTGEGKGGQGRAREANGGQGRPMEGKGGQWRAREGV
ncbi:hypothetical protein FPQ18DRAFT_421389 [Pyronema domesticum]|nr:hypothetical protein FPQ18DRAFT_421389 [Pyronema domesticum]